MVSIAINLSTFDIFIPWVSHMSDIGVMAVLASKQGCSAGTAIRNGGEVLGKCSSFVHDEILHVLHVVQRIQMKILIVGKNKDNIGPLGVAGW